MRLPRSLTTVTLFSKTLAGILFLALLLTAFLAGMKFQAMTDLIKIQQSNPLKAKPSPTPVDTVNWKTYTNNTYLYSIQYPSDKFVICNDSQDDNLILREAKDCYPYGETFSPFVLSVNLPLKSQSYKQSLDEDCYSVKKEIIKIAGMDATRYSNSIKNSTGKCNSLPIAYAGNKINIDLLYNNNTYTFYFIDSYASLANKIISTFKFTNSSGETTSPTPTCRPRPACLDATPRCMIPETSDMCPKATPTPKSNQTACSMEAKLCPDGKNYVSRTGPNCEFSPCP